MADKKTDQVPPLVLVNRMSEEAVFPSGFILSTAKPISVPYRQKTKVPTDLRFTVPFGVSFQIVPIPDLAQKSISVSEGYIGPCTDAPVTVTMHNYSGSHIELKAGDQIAQLKISDIIAPEFVDVTPRID
nr:hypothetical protein LSAT_V11C300140770 [Lactuca sativa]